MKKIILIYLVLFGQMCFSQNIERYSIDSGGAYFNNGGSQILFTIGEIVVGESSSGNINLSEGFISGEIGQSLSVSNLIKQDEINIYPNPTAGVLFIKDVNSKIIKIEIYSILGQRLMEINNNFKKIDIADLQSAMYFIKLIFKESSSTFKVMKD